MTTTLQQLERDFPGDAASKLLLMREDGTPAVLWRLIHRVDLNTVITRPDHLKAAAQHLDSGGALGFAIPPGYCVLECGTRETAQWVDMEMDDLEVPWQRFEDGAQFLLRLPPAAFVSGHALRSFAESIGDDPVRHLDCGDITIKLDWIPVGDVQIPFDLDATPVIPPELLKALVEC